MGIKRDKRSLWVGISHCWSHASGSSVVLSAGFHDHISDRMNACVLVMVPLLAGASVFLVRWFVSPYPIYMQVRRTLDTLTDTKKEERAKAIHGCFERSAAILKQHHSLLLSF